MLINERLVPAIHAPGPTAELGRRIAVEWLLWELNPRAAKAQGTETFVLSAMHSAARRRSPGLVQQPSMH